jgi:hypothetical protein
MLTGKRIPAVLKVVVGALSVVAAIVITVSSCGKNSQPAAPSKEISTPGSYRIGSPPLLKTPGYTVYPVEGRTDELAVQYTEITYTDPQTGASETLTYAEADAMLQDGDMVDLSFVWQLVVTTSLKSIPPKPASIVIDGDGGGGPPENGGGSAPCGGCECMTPDPVRPGVCHGTWACLKKCWPF